MPMTRQSSRGSRTANSASEAGVMCWADGTFQPSTVRGNTAIGPSTTTPEFRWNPYCGQTTLTCVNPGNRAEHTQITATHRNFDPEQDNRF